MNYRKRIYLKEQIVTGAYPGPRVDVTLKPGDTIYFCYRHKNKSKKEFYVLEGTVDSWEPNSKNPNIGMYKVTFLYNYREKYASNKLPLSLGKDVRKLHSNEVGDTPERAVNNMLRFPWERY